MKDEDASCTASSLDRIATGLEQLNELFERKTQGAKAGIPKWVWAAGVIGVGVFIWTVLRTH